MRIGPDYKNDYNFPFDEVLGPGTNQYGKELFIYSVLRGNFGKSYRKKLGIDKAMHLFDFRNPFTHLCNAIQLGLPPGEVDFIVDGIVNEPLMRMLWACCNEDDVCFAGSASTGKTFCVALWCVFDWLAQPDCTTTLVGSTTIESLDDRIWRDISGIYRALIYKIGDIVDHKRAIYYRNPGKTDGGNREFHNAIKCIAIEKGSEGKKVVVSTKGRKNLRFRVMLDEMTEMDMYVSDFKVNLASNADFVAYGIGNPANGRNPHRELALPLGHNDFPPEHVNWKQWKTRTGVCVFVSGLDTPNMKVGPEDEPPFPYLATHSTIARQLELCYGNKNSLLYWQNAIGGWPAAGVQTSVLTEALVVSSNTLQEPAWADSPEMLMALDPAFTVGGDNAALCYGKLGDGLCQMIADPSGSFHASSLKKALHLQAIELLQLDQSGDYITNLATAVVDKMLMLRVKPKNFCLDVSSDGGRVAQAIMRELESRGIENFTDIVLISSMGTPTDRRVSEVDSRKCSDVYDRRVSEYWFAVATAIITRCFFGLDPKSEAAQQFYSRGILSKNKKQAVITKKEMKSIYGRSPDESDAVAYLIELARRQGLYFIGDDKVEVPDFEDIRNGYYNKRGRKEEVIHGHYEDDDDGEF